MNNFYIINNFYHPHNYSELMSHENVTFNENGTLTATPHHPLEWREDLSEGRREDDIFYLPNIALLVSNYYAGLGLENTSELYFFIHFFSSSPFSHILSFS